MIPYSMISKWNILEGAVHKSTWGSEKYTDLSNKYQSSPAAR